eukprot:SAG31_NODE_4960_length_2834_cov_2.174040_1_plen_25_part_10
MGMAAHLFLVTTFTAILLNLFSFFS